MSRRAAAILGVATMWCVVRGAYGQDLDRLRFRADSIATLWRDAQMLVTLQDSLRRTTLPATMEHVEAGALAVIADPSKLPLQQATTAAWERLDAFYGSAAQKIAGHPVVLFVVGTLPRTPNQGPGMRIPNDLSLADLTSAIARLAPIPRGDRVLKEWLGMALMPGDDPARERTVVYVELVTAHASIARRCFSGDAAACTDALGLVPLEGAPERWWTAAERRQIVETSYASYYYRNRSGLRALTTACVQQSVDSACVRLLEGADPHTWPWPLSPGARAVLLRLALDRGGRDAYRRLVTDTLTPVPERLASVAGVPLDSLVAEWRRVVTTARPRPVAVPWGNALVALGWLGFLMVCAMRSSRWRLG